MTRPRWFLAFIGLFLFATASFYVWLVYIPPMRPKGVNWDYSFAWTDLHTGVWIGCWRINARRGAARCKEVRQDGYPYPDFTYLTYPPGTALPGGRLRVDGHATDPTMGVFHNMESPNPEYESIIILKGGVVLLPEDEYAKAVAEYTRQRQTYLLRQ